VLLTKRLVILAEGFLAFPESYDTCKQAVTTWSRLPSQPTFTAVLPLFIFGLINEFCVFNFSAIPASKITLNDIG
jgi:hypothetical protein